jgi:hypothetical protein
MSNVYTTASGIPLDAGMTMPPGTRPHGAKPTKHPCIEVEEDPPRLEEEAPHTNILSGFGAAPLATNTRDTCLSSLGSSKNQGTLMTITRPSQARKSRHPSLASTITERPKEER